MSVVFGFLAGAAIGYVLDQYRQARRRARVDDAIVRARTAIGDERWREYGPDE